MAAEPDRDPDLEWLDHVRPVGLVVAPSLLKTLGLVPPPQTAVDTAAAAELIDLDSDGPALVDPWAFMEQTLGWGAGVVTGAPGGPGLRDSLEVHLPEYGVTLRPTWAVQQPKAEGESWQLLVAVEPPGVDPDKPSAGVGWGATSQQKFERLLRETGIFVGLMITDKVLRLTFAPRGETSGHLSFPIRALASVTGRPMLGGLKLLLNAHRLFIDAPERRLPALLAESREAQAQVSTELAGQVLGALHELLRGFDAAEPALVRDLAEHRPGHLYEGLLAVLMRLVFILYAEDRDLLPSRTGAHARSVYDTSYAVRGLYGRLTDDAALNPDTMDERRGGWGRLLALFRLIHSGHTSHFIQARGGKLFDPQAFPFLEGRAASVDPPAVPHISDGCLLRVLDGLLTVKVRGQARERLSYRTLDVEQIGSVYETVMGFDAALTQGPSLAIKAGKNNRTPIFVDLAALLAESGKTRVKYLKEEVGRSLSSAEAKPVEVAATLPELAAALGRLVDERASPGQAILAAGAPILQPTGERRRTGSHYTPRSLTAPIVKQALEPAFARLGDDALPEAVLELKVCDPAMGSGAFLVEACRVIGERLVKAWAKWPETRPTMPGDEDEELHARRLVAQRCLYGVDKNPRAVDLAKLSLWLATLARDHEFSFLDHALKCGDSLVGLDMDQLRALHWDPSKAGVTLFSQMLRERVDEALAARDAIRTAPDDISRAMQEARHRALESRLDPVRTMADAVVAAFFSSDKPKPRERRRVDVEQRITRYPIDLAGLERDAAELEAGEHPLPPFHWRLEFPEVFGRADGGFDAIVGNPPFAGKNTVIAGNRANYLPWLQAVHEGAHGNADLVAHFFLRAFDLLRPGGQFGLIATNTIGQGDTRATGLTTILSNGGAIATAIRRRRWPGEAAVVVSVVQVRKGPVATPLLDGRPVRRISAYLVEGDLDTSPASLAVNSGKAFQGSIVLGMGFTFDDAAATKGEAESLGAMRGLIERNPRNAERIFPYIGGEEVNNSPALLHHRYVVDFADFPLRRDGREKSWLAMSREERQEALAAAVVPRDYPDPVAADWPDLLEIIERLVRPDRAKLGDNPDARRRKKHWWLYGRAPRSLYSTISRLDFVLATNAGAAPHLAFAKLPTKFVFANTLNIFAFDSLSSFAVLQGRAHETWARFFSSSMKDDLRYTPSDCFRNFPFPRAFEIDKRLEAVGKACHEFRAQLLVERSEGLTKTYNRFHDRAERSADILRLRELHAEMDRVVLAAYGWDELAAQAEPQFIEQEADEGKVPKTRYDWPGDFKDEVLARLLVLNAERAAAERAAGLVPAIDDDEVEALEEAT